MAELPTEITINIRFEFSQGHNDPKTLPTWMYQQFPTEVIGYAATAYLAGVEVGQRMARAEDGESEAGQ